MPTLKGQKYVVYMVPLAQNGQNMSLKATYHKRAKKLHSYLAFTKGLEFAIFLGYTPDGLHY